MTRHFDPNDGIVIVCGGYYALLEYRVEQAVFLNPEFLVFTGGFDEAENSRKIYSLKGGSNSSRILLEEKSTTTKENADFTRLEFAKNEDFLKKSSKITVVSDGFHGIRCLLLFREAFPHSQVQFVGAKNNLFLVIYKWSLREVLAIVKGLLKQHYTLSQLLKLEI